MKTKLKKNKYNEPKLGYIRSNYVDKNHLFQGQYFHYDIQYKFCKISQLKNDITNGVVIKINDL